MIASLPMYDLPSTAAANDRFWTLVRGFVGHGPTKLSRNTDPWIDWQSPDLLLSQTCGLPYRTRLHEHVQLVGTPDYGLCTEQGSYYSVLLTRRSDDKNLRNYSNRIFAYNEQGSQSGWSAPQYHAQVLGFWFNRTLATGSHLASALAVAEQRADITALDAVTWQLIGKTDARFSHLDVIARTDPTPGLPMITAKSRDPGPIFRALQTAIEALDENDRQILHLTGITRIEADRYLAVPIPLTF